MQYATVQDLIDRFSERELIALTDKDENAAINTARAQVALDDARVFTDGYLGQVYRLPLAGCAKPGLPGNPVERVSPPQLTRIVCDVARYYLHDDLAPEHEVYRRYKDTQAQLQAIAEGRLLLSCPWGGSPGVPLAGDAQSGQEVRFAFSPRAIGQDVAEHYK
jgi:phage gp36-like protein